jgi:CheY-like chemotaxis protein
METRPAGLRAQVLRALARTRMRIGTRRIQHRHAVIVDDSRFAALDLAARLQSLNITVEIVDTGQAAMAIDPKIRPELWFVDVVLPDMDGLALVLQLRQAQGARRARFFSVSGYGGEAEHLRARRAGCEAHLIKPVKADELEKLLG